MSPIFRAMEQESNSLVELQLHVTGAFNDDESDALIQSLPNWSCIVLQLNRLPDQETRPSESVIAEQDPRDRSQGSTETFTPESPPLGARTSAWTQRSTVTTGSFDEAPE